MQNKDNFLDYVFAYPEGLVFTCSDEGEVTVDMENKGFTNKVAQRFFKRPKVSHIKLEGMGSFIFLCVDGKRKEWEASSSFVLTGRDLSMRSGSLFMRNSAMKPNLSMKG